MRKGIIVSISRILLIWYIKYSLKLNTHVARMIKHKKTSQTIKINSLHSGCSIEKNSTLDFVHKFSGPNLWRKLIFPNWKVFERNFSSFCETFRKRTPLQKWFLMNFYSENFSISSKCSWLAVATACTNHLFAILLS